jgi:membrane protein
LTPTPNQLEPDVVASAPRSRPFSSLPDWVKVWQRRGSAGPAVNGRSLRPTVRSIRSAVESEQSRLTQMAAALSYRTIFGMIPVLVVSLVALKAFTTPAQIESLLGQGMRLAGLDKIAVDAGDMPVISGEPQPDSGSDPQAASKENGPNTPVPSDTSAADPPSTNTGSTRLDQWIKTTALSFDKFSLSAIGYAGIAMLIYAAVSMLVEIEHCFNQIFRVPSGRSWTRRITHYWTLLTLGTVLLAATFVVGQRFEKWMTEFTQAGRFVGADKISVNAIAFLTTVLISTLLFLLAYTVIPNTRVKLRPALVGALVAAILWETGKWAFSQYLVYSTSYQKFYGSIALIPLFLLWIYAAWMIVLFGLYVTYQLQHVRTRTIAQPVDSIEPAIIDPGSIVSVMGGLAVEFQSGKSIEARDLAKKLGLYEPAVGQMLGRLAEAGQVHRISKGELREDEFVLARPPEMIDAEQVLLLGEEMAGLNTADLPEGFARSIREGRLASVRGKTLASFLPAPSNQLASSSQTVPSTQPSVSKANPAITDSSAGAHSDTPANGHIADSGPHSGTIKLGPANGIAPIEMPFRSGPSKKA